MKNKELEEVAKKYAIYELENNYKPTKESFKLACKRNFIRAAKWQKEQDKNKYSEEDLKIAFDAGESFGSLPFSSMSTSNRLSKEEWFKQFKKK